MDFKVNEFTTIYDLELMDIIHVKMKFGEEYDYQKFHGKLSGKTVTGWLCLDDDQIWGLTELQITELTDVGFGIDKDRTVYPKNADGSCNLSKGMDLSECIEDDEWLDKCSINDRIKINQL